jgi:DNA repair protein RadC
MAHDQSEFFRARRRSNLVRISEIKVTATRSCLVKKNALILDNPSDLVALYCRVIPSASWFDAAKESIVVFALNVRGRVVGWNLVSLGTATNSLAHCREVFRPVISLAATAFSLAHNHPSGDPAPSRSDMILTRKIRDGARVLDIAFEDHVIVGELSTDPRRKGYFSFREAGLL